MTNLNQSKAYNHRHNTIAVVSVVVVQITVRVDIPHIVRVVSISRPQPIIAIGTRPDLKLILGFLSKES